MDIKYYFVQMNGYQILLNSDECLSTREPAVYISRPYGSWLHPSNWNLKYPSPVPHTQQVAHSTG